MYEYDTTTTSQRYKAKGYTKVVMDVLSCALGYAEQGLSVFPCGRDKKPLTAHGFKDASTDPDVIKKMWTHNPGASIGWAVPESKIVLDIDLPAGPDTLTRLEAIHGPLPATKTQQTGGGGLQYIFTLPDGVTAKNSAGKIGPGIDTRSKGGYAILPPSGHPSGGTYQWIDTREAAVCPGWVLDVIKPKPAPRQAPSRVYFAGSDHPYIKAAVDNELQNLAIAPDGQRNNALNIASVKFGHFVGGGSLSEMDAADMLLNTALSIGLPQREAEATIKSGLSAGMRDPRGVPESQGAFVPSVPIVYKNLDQKKWESPIPLDDNTPNVMDRNILSGPLGDMARAVAIETETPIEMPIGIGLSALATACHGKLRIQIKSGYQEPLNLWVVVAFDPANRKTSVLSKMTAPLTEWEREQQKQMEPWVKEAISRRKNQESRLKSLRTSYGKADTDSLKEIEAEILEIENDLEEVPVFPKVWAQDITPEHLGTIMDQQNECMSIISAEGGIFDIAAGRYSNGVPNLDLFLQGHAGDAVRVDRGSREPVYMDNPALTFGLSPQPGVLRGLSDKPGFRARGLLARFNYLLPESKLGYRALDTPPVPESIKTNYHHLIFQLLNLEVGEGEHGDATPRVLSLSEPAYQEWAEFYNAVEMDLRDDGRFEHVRDWAGKLPGAAARIAGLLHCADNPQDPWTIPVSLGTMITALELSAVFADHALIAFDLMGADTSLEGARKVWRWVEKNRLEEFKKRDCHNALQGTFKRVKDLEEPLSVLIERNYIQDETQKTGGRPSIMYRVNPEITKGWS